MEDVINKVLDLGIRSEINITTRNNLRNAEDKILMNIIVTASEEWTEYETEQRHILKSEMVFDTTDGMDFWTLERIELKRLEVFELRTGEYWRLYGKNWWDVCESNSIN